MSGEDYLSSQCGCGSFTVLLDVELVDGKRIRFEENSDQGDFCDLHVMTGPQFLGESSSIRQLLIRLWNCMTGLNPKYDTDDDLSRVAYLSGITDHGDAPEEEMRSGDAETHADLDQEALNGPFDMDNVPLFHPRYGFDVARRGIDRLKGLSSMDEIASIRLCCTESAGEKKYQLIDLVYDRRSKHSFGIQDGQPIFHALGEGMDGLCGEFVPTLGDSCLFGNHGKRQMPVRGQSKIRMDFI